MIVWANKDPEEVLDYQNRWNLDVGETLLTSVHQIVSGDCTMDLTKPHDITDAVNNITTVWLAGGTVANSPTLVLNRVTTSKGRTYEQTARVRIREK
jgi:hypothetical protein